MMLVLAAVACDSTEDGKSSDAGGSNAADSGNMSNAGIGGEKDSGVSSMEDAGPMLPDNGEVVGRVFRADKLTALAGVEITGPGGVVTKTNKKGEFTLRMLKTERTALLANFKGYAQAVEPVTVIAGQSTSIEFRMLKISVTASLSAGLGGAVRALDGSEVVVDKNAFVDASGKPVTGMVSVELTVLDPSTPEGLQAFPGDFTATNGKGEDGQLESYVPMEITVRQGDKVLDFAGGKGADVSFPVPDNLKDKAPQTIELWSLSETTGAWVIEGTASLTLDSAGKLVYRARIQHMSWWNCDQFISEVTCIRGCVEKDGVRVPYAKTQAEGITYTNLGESKTNSTGCFVEDVRAGGQLRVRASQDSAISEWKVITAPTTRMFSFVDSSKCFDIGTLDISVPKTANDGCPTGTSKCGDTCVDLGTSYDHCGTCSTSCFGALGEAQCISGKCACSGSQTKCDSKGMDVCTDLNADDNNCGQCGKQCGAGQTCAAGSCKMIACAAGQTACDGYCVDTKLNAQHCGQCGNACDGGNTCSAGRCKQLTCAAGSEPCGNVCVAPGQCKPTTGGDAGNGGAGSTAGAGGNSGSGAAGSTAGEGASGNGALDASVGGDDDGGTTGTGGTGSSAGTGGSQPDAGVGGDECPINMLPCADKSGCISEGDICDETEQCVDGSDEVGCGQAGTGAAGGGAGGIGGGGIGAGGIGGGGGIGAGGIGGGAGDGAAGIGGGAGDGAGGIGGGAGDGAAGTVATCTPTQFTCPGETNCRPISSLCDKVADCPKGEDEIGCGGAGTGAAGTGAGGIGGSGGGEGGTGATQVCGPQEKKCPSGQCVAEGELCPGEQCEDPMKPCPTAPGGCALPQDCEMPTECDPATQISCTNGTAGAICATVCNSNSECAGEIDEDPGMCCSRSNGTYCTVEGTPTCVPASQTCAADGPQCDDGRDEDVKFCCGQLGGIQCSDAAHNPICVPANQVCANDGAQCDDGRDEEPNLCCQRTGQNVCPSGEGCMPPGGMCDSANDCADGSDEASCGGCPAGQVQCWNNTCAPSPQECPPPPK